MRSVFLYIIILLGIAGCGEFIPGKGNNDLTVVSERPPVNAGGLAIKISNALMQDKPDISVVVCAREKEFEVIRNHKDKEPPKKEELCFGSYVTVKYNEQVIYHLSKTLTGRLIEKAKDGGKIEVLFNDSHSRSLIHWHCYPGSDLKVKTNTKVTQYVDLTVTQSNLASYSCLVGSF